MSPGVAAALGLISLAVALGASEILVRGLDRLGVHLRLREGLLGLLTAVGADAPEMTAAIAALHSGAHAVGLGVAIGSNLFNLAALLGLGALVAGHVRVRRAGLALDGSVALLITALTAVLLQGLLPAAAVVAVVATVLLCYAILLGLPPSRFLAFPLPQVVARRVTLAVEEVEHEARVEHHGPPSWWPIALIFPSLACIVVASSLLVTAALTLADYWTVTPRLVGAVILAGLTSLPNAYAAVRLALQHRGTAVVSETVNSNSINLIGGVCLPVLVFGAGGAANDSLLDIAWLFGVTTAAIVLLARRSGLNRAGGAAIILLYAVFVFVRVVQW